MHTKNCVCVLINEDRAPAADVMTNAKRTICIISDAIDVHDHDHVHDLVHDPTIDNVHRSNFALTYRRPLQRRQRPLEIFVVLPIGCWCCGHKNWKKYFWKFSKCMRSSKRKQKSIKYRELISMYCVCVCVGVCALVYLMLVCEGPPDEVAAAVVRDRAK